MVYSTNDLMRQREQERIKGAHRLSYRTDLYKRYTGGKDPDAVVYNGFVITRPDGEKIYFTIHYRTDNARPYAIYQNGSQTHHQTYIYRFYCEKLLKQIARDFQTMRPDFKIDHIRGAEIIT